MNALAIDSIQVRDIMVDREDAFEAIAGELEDPLDASS